MNKMSVWNTQFQAPSVFRQSAHESSKIVSPMHRPPLPTLNSFMLEAESIPGPQCGHKD